MNSVAQQILGALFRICKIFYRHSSYSFGFTFVGDEIVQTGDRSEIYRLAGSRIQNAANAMLSCKRDCVIHGLKRNFELEDDTIDGLQQVGGGFHVGRL